MSLYRLSNGEIEFGEAKRLPTGQIRCLVKVVELDNEVVEFIASSDDCEDYGRELYEMLDTKYSHEVAPVTQEELDKDAEDLVKSRRYRELKDTDWTQLPDVPMNTKEAWAVYRQALRDITEQEGYPQEVVWPSAPN